MALAGTSADRRFLPIVTLPVDLEPPRPVPTGAARCRSRLDRADVLIFSLRPNGWLTFDCQVDHL
ncbi:hypothetical protein KNE206_54650 [Kitasatospora sp. NE20-6]